MKYRLYQDNLSDYFADCDGFDEDDFRNYSNENSNRDYISALDYENTSRLMRYYDVCHMPFSCYDCELLPEKEIESLSNLPILDVIMNFDVKVLLDIFADIIRLDGVIVAYRGSKESHFVRYYEKRSIKLIHSITYSLAKKGALEFSLNNLNVADIDNNRLLEYLLGSLLDIFIARELEKLSGTDQLYFDFGSKGTKNAISRLRERCSFYLIREMGFRNRAKIFRGKIKILEKNNINNKFIQAKLSLIFCVNYNSLDDLVTDTWRE